MRTVILILIIIFIVWPLARYAWQRWVQPWLIRRASRKMEDYIRAAAGMPPREKESRGKKHHSRQPAGSSRQPGGNTDWEGPLIPKEYAVDVEFTEIREYSSVIEITGEESSRHHRKRSASKVTVESQVSDVEYVEIKTRN